MSDMTFEVAKRRREPITFSIGGDEHEYVFSPPKQAVMVLPFLSDESGEGDILKSTFEWLDKGLSTEDQDRIIGRLKDEEDDLDIDTLGTIVQSLAEKVAARPTM